MTQTPKAQELTRARPSLAPRSLHVLVVDDDEGSRLGMELAVRDLGHRCSTASDGAAAFEIATRDRPDMILSDLMMPGMDGLELCRRVRDLPGEYIYFVFTSAMHDKAHVLRGLESGADDYLGKPIDLDELEARVRAASRLLLVQKQVTEQNALLRRDSQQLFAASRIDALTQLLLPPVTASPAAGTPTEALAGTLPTFFADALLADALTQSPEAARRALTRGAPAALVSAFGKGDAPVTKDGTTAIAYARARLALGMRSWRGVDFDQAARVAHGAASPDARLVLATALALGRGPDGAAAMMASRARCTSDGWGDAAAKCSPTPELELMHVEALDALGGAGAPHDAYATFNAAYLLWISTPPCCGGAETTAHFKDVRDRFARASSKLNGAPQKRAEDLHRQAAELVEALAKPH